MTEPNDLDAVVEAVTARLSALADPPDVPTAHQVAVVGFVAEGPAPAELMQEILADERLVRLLSQIWRREPPTPEHRARMLADPYGRQLLHHAAPQTDDLQPAVQLWAATSFAHAAREWGRRRGRELVEVLSPSGGLALGAARGSDSATESQEWIVLEAPEGTRVEVAFVMEPAPAGLLVKVDSEDTAGPVQLALFPADPAIDPVLTDTRHIEPGDVGVEFFAETEIRPEQLAGVALLRA